MDKRTNCEITKCPLTVGPNVQRRAGEVMIGPGRNISYHIMISWGAKKRWCLVWASCVRAVGEGGGSFGIRGGVSWRTRICRYRGDVIGQRQTPPCGVKCRHCCKFRGFHTDAHCTPHETPNTPAPTQHKHVLHLSSTLPVFRVR